MNLPARQPALARALEWLWRGQALLAAGTPAQPAVHAHAEQPTAATTSVARQRDRAQVAFDAAVRLTRPSEEHDTRVPDAQLTAALALSIYREAAHWALSAAAGGLDARSIAEAFKRLPAELLASLALAPDKLEATRDALERDVVASAELDLDACARDTQLVRDFVEALLRQLGTREERELCLLRERVLRVAGVGALLLLCLLAVALVPRALRPDLAEHAAWRVSSTTPNYPATGQGGKTIQARAATPGPNVAGETTLLFHTDQEPSPWIEFDLGQVRALHRVRLVNRADCCWDRVAPLAIELSDDGRHFREVVRRDELFYDWSTSLGGHEARYLRVRALRPTMLHLTRVEIH